MLSRPCALACDARIVLRSTFALLCFAICGAVELSAQSAGQLQGGQGQAVAERAKRLRVATYNLENLFDNHDNPYKPDEGTSPKSRAEIAVLARTIDALDADVLAVQEVENREMLQRLNTRLRRPYAYIEMLPGNDMRGIHCAILSRVRVVRSTGHRTWPLEGKRVFARDVPIFELEPSPGQRLLVTSLHLKSKRSDGSDRQSNKWRTAEAKAIVEILAELRKAGQKAPFVLLGDLNDERDSEPLAPLFGKFVDATSAVAAETRYSYVYAGRKQQIDHVLHDGELRVLAARFVHDKDSASDHTPVVVDYAWPAAIVRAAPPSTGEASAPTGRRRIPRLKASDSRSLRRHLLAEVEVEGTIAKVEATRSGGHFNLRFEAAQGRRAFTLFVQRHAVPRFPGLHDLRGKRVVVAGPLFVYRGRLEMKLTRKSQFVEPPK